MAASSRDLKEEKRKSSSFAVAVVLQSVIRLSPWNHKAIRKRGVYCAVAHTAATFLLIWECSAFSLNGNYERNKKGPLQTKAGLEWMGPAPIRHECSDSKCCFMGDDTRQLCRRTCRGRERKRSTEREIRWAWHRERDQIAPSAFCTCTVRLARCCFQ